jgi:hypothetical protein
MMQLFADAVNGYKNGLVYMLKIGLMEGTNNPDSLDKMDIWFIIKIISIVFKKGV